MGCALLYRAQQKIMTQGQSWHLLAPRSRRLQSCNPYVGLAYNVGAHSVHETTAFWIDAHSLTSFFRFLPGQDRSGSIDMGKEGFETAVHQPTLIQALITASGRAVVFVLVQFEHLLFFSVFVLMLSCISAVEIVFLAPPAPGV
jgi:hypothetical protein